MSTVSIKRNIKKKTAIKSENIIEQIAFWGFCILLVFSPFFSGLFFAKDQRVALIFAMIIFWLTSLIYYRGENRIFSVEPLNFMILGLPLIYMMATFSAANYAFSLDEVIENLLYFLVFWSAVKLLRSGKNIRNIFFVIYLTALGVSIAGIFTASGFLQIKDGFLTSDGGTIASTFQYKNSLASFLTASIFIGSYLREELSTNLHKGVLSVGNFLLLMVFFSTQSHGGYIIFGIFMVVLWFLSPISKRFSLITSTIILSLLGLLVSKMFLFGITEKNIGLAWLWIIGGITVVSLGQWAIMKFCNSDSAIKITFRQLLITMIIIIIVGSAALGSLGVFQIIMEKIHMHGAMERLTIYQDGLKMIKERPILGWGGGGWSEAYSIYQGYGYTARQTHSYFLQIAIETGLAGLLIAATIWIIFLIKSIKIYIASLTYDHSRSLVATLICSVLAIISHAVFDFDLSLAALTITMFTLMACLVAVGSAQEAESKETKETPKNKFSRYKLAISTTLAVTVIGGTLIMISSSNLASASVNAVTSGDGERAETLIHQAIMMNPLASENYGIASQLQGVVFGKQDKAIEYAEKAARMARYNPERQYELAIAYLRANQNDQAVSAAQKAVELAPLKVRYYELFSNVLISAATSELKAGRDNIASKFINQTLSIPKNMNSVMESVQPEKRELWVYAPPLTVTDKIKLNIGIANLLAGNLDQAVSNINEAAQNPEVQKESLIWQALLAQRQGDLAKSQEILQKAEKENPSIKKQFAELASLKLLSN